MRAVLGDKGCWIEGNATPFGMSGALLDRRKLGNGTGRVPSA
ncbi:MAG: hypothetical protein ACXWPK_07505 [Isosphaeraceae bacterium]